MKSNYLFEFLEMDDQTVAVPVGEAAQSFHGILRLNETAEIILELLKEEITEEQIVDVLMKEYTGDKAIIADYVHTYVGKLIEAGIVS